MGGGGGKIRKGIRYIGESDEKKRRFNQLVNFGRGRK